MNLKVLIVNANTALSEALLRLVQLHAPGCHVGMSACHVEAMQFIKNEQPALVIADADMHGSGFHEKIAMLSERSTVVLHSSFATSRTTGVIPTDRLASDLPSIIERIGASVP